VLRRCGGNSALVARVFEEFQTQSAGDLVLLRSLLEKNGAPEVARIAHGLKGAAANLAAEPLRALAAQLEALARTGDLAAAAPVLGSLTNEVARCSAEFQRTIPALRSGEKAP